MNINIEDFKKLKQIDRIEFLLRKSRIDSKYDSNYTSYFFMLLAINAFILGVVLKNMFIVKIGLLIVLVAIFFSLVNLMSLMINKKKTLELEREYFKLDIKAK